MKKSYLKKKIKEFGLDKITFDSFAEHYENQKELGEEERKEFETDYPKICKGVHDEEELKEYIQDMIDIVINR